MRIAKLLLQFNEITDCLTNGQPIPDQFYRLGIGKNRDRLLEETGVKHLHLGSPGSNIVLYLIEFESSVVLLDLNSHVHLEDEPRGRLLRKIFGPRWS